MSINIWCFGTFLGFVFYVIKMPQRCILILAALNREFKNIPNKYQN